MATVADYVAWKAKQQQQNVAKANIVLSADWQQEPDQVAADMAFAKEASAAVGNPVPVQMVSDPDTRTVFQRIIAEKKQSTILSSSPQLADWLRTPQNAALARDDLEGLSWWETSTGAAANALQRSAMRLPQMYNQWMAEGAGQRAADADKSFLEIYSQEQATAQPIAGALYNPAEPVTDLLGAGTRFLQSRLSQAFGGDQQQAAAYYQQQVGMISNEIASIPMSPAATVGRDAVMGQESTGDVMGDVQQFFVAVAQNPAEFAAFLAEVTIESLPALAAATAVTAATRNPSAGAAVMGGLSGVQERFLSPADLMAERGIDISTPEGALAAISDRELMRDAVERGEIRGLIIGALDTISGGVAGEILSKSPVANLALQSVIGSVLGGTGEAAAQVASGQELNINEVLVEALAEFVIAPVEVGSMAAGRIRDGMAKSSASSSTVAAITDITNQATASVTRNRSPDTFRNFLATVTANGARENLFVPAEAFTEYFQSAGIDPFNLADQLAGMSRADLQTAVETGGAVQIPTATWAADMAGSEHDAFIIQNSAFSPDDMTGMQAAEFEAVKNDLLAEAWAEAEAIRQDAESLRAIYDQERDQVIGALRAAGRSLDVALAEALPLVAFRRTMAERSGLTPEEFAARYPLPEVRGERPEGLDPKNVDVLTRTLAEARARRKVEPSRGPTLLEFISERGGITDPGGELKARDAAVLKRGRGKKTLKLERAGLRAAGDLLGLTGSEAHGFDDVARAAIEAGYMAGDPLVLEYQEAQRAGTETPEIGRALLAAIDRELAGQAEYSQTVEQSAAAEMVDGLDSVEEYLASLGVSLEDSDADIRAAIEGDADGRAYGQSATEQVTEQVLQEHTQLVQSYMDADTGFSPSYKKGMLDDGNFSKGECEKLSNDLAEWLNGNGVPAQVVAVTGFKSQLDTGAAGGWVEFVGDKPERTKFFWHAVVYTGQSIIDVTGSQYGDKFAGIRVMRPEAFAADWSKAETNPTEAAQKRKTIRLITRPTIYNQSPQHLFTPTDTTQTPAFKAWFGDSKVVGPDGKPLVVYHGTTKEFEAFASGNRNGMSVPREGFYFTENQDAASEFGQTGEYYLSIQKPADFSEGQGQAIVDAVVGSNPELADKLGRVIEAAYGEPGLSVSRLSRRGLLQDREFVAALKTEGYDGLVIDDDFAGHDFISHIAFEPTQIKSVNNRGTFDPSNPSLLFQADAGFGMGGGSARGSIQFPGAGVSNGQTIISLFQTADLSTFLHESGHYFLTVLQDMARLDPSTPVAAEFETIRSWWRDNAEAVARDSGAGVTAADVITALDNGTTGNLDLDQRIDTGMQEQFARASETYMLEGKAPSQDLRAAFEKFHAWLLSIYRNLRGLNVQMTDELRGVFDRLLATDTEIDAARADIGADVHLTADDLGMTPEQFDGFVKLRDQARDEAKAKLLAQTMAPIERARQKWFKDERKKVREDVARNMNAQPVYRAIEWMGNRRWLGDTATDMPEFRLSKSVLVERYGEGVLSNLPRGQQTIYAVDGGMDPNDVAGWFGFQSGDAMVQAMERAPKRVEAIEAETDVQMRERHGDVLRDGSVEELALEAVHNDKRSRVLAAELQALNEIAGTDRGLTAKDARESARRTLSQMKTRDALRGDRFLAAERKAAGEVARLSATVTREGVWMDRARRRVETQARGAVRDGDGNAALTLPVERANQNTQRFNENAAALVEAKRRQLMNHALYSESLAVADEVSSAERLVGKLTKAVQRRRAQDGKQTVSNEHLDAIAEIIERYDFRKMSGNAEERRGALNRYVEQMIAAGRENELAIPKKVLDDAARTPYRTLSVADLRGVVDTLKNLESMGRRWQKLLIAKKQREMDEAVDIIVTGLRDNVGSSQTPWVDVGWKTSVKGAVNQYLSTFTTATTVLRKIDGREDMGGAYELLKSDIDNAAFTERDMRETAAGKIEELYSVYSRDEQRQMGVMKQVQGLGSFSKWNLIAMALNMGNEGNIHRLTNKNARVHLTPAQVEMVKGLLDKRDWDFVQSIWDYLDTYRPQIAERQKRVTGVEPEWVEATAVETPVGTYRGGYYPIKYSTKHGGASTPSLSSEDDIIRSMQVGSYSKAATKNGHLESRVANVQQSLLLDVGVIATHTNEVIHDLTFSEPIVNSWRLLNDSRVSSAFLDAGMQEQHEALKLWLKDAAVGQVFSSDFMSRSVRNLRSGFTVSRLSWNFGTALLQPTGILQSAVAVGKRNLANAIIRYARNPKAMTDEVVSRSRIMKERRTTFQKDLMDMVAETNISSPSASALKGPMDALFIKGGMAAMMYTQFYTVDVPTWAAAFDKGMRQFDGNQAKATEYADMTIGRVQGSGLWTDRSNIERGTLSATVRQNAFVTLFTTLGSYFFAKMNMLIERTDAVRSGPITAGTAASYAFDVGLLLAGEAAVMMLVGAGKDALFGGDDDDDDDENPAMTLGVEALKVFAAGLPGIRDGVSVYQGFSGGTYAGVMDLLVKPAKEVAQGEFDKGMVKSFVNLAGVAARLPAAQANRIIDAGWRDFEGEDVAAMEYLLGRQR